MIIPIFSLYPISINLYVLLVYTTKQHVIILYSFYNMLKIYINLESEQTIIVLSLLLIVLLRPHLARQFLVHSKHLPKPPFVVLTNLVQLIVFPQLFLRPSIADAQLWLLCNWCTVFLIINPFSMRHIA